MNEILNFDNLHINYRPLHGYNKTWNAVFCPREAGKTTKLEYEQIFLNIKQGYGTCIMVRYAKEVSKHTLKACEDRINQFLHDKINFYADIKIGGGMITGSIHFSIYQNHLRLPGEGLLVWIGLDEQILKKMYLKEPRWLIMDEYVLNPQSGEKYCKNEMHKILMLHGTLSRYCHKSQKLKTFLIGNAYTKFTPFIEYFKIDINKLKEGAIISGDNFVVWCYQLKDELKHKLELLNPNYKYDDLYRRFALEGKAIYDEGRINVCDNVLPKFKIDYVILTIDENFKKKYLGVYYNSGNKQSDLYFIIKEINENNIKYLKNKAFYSFGFKDMEKRCILLNESNKDVLNDLNDALCEGKVGFVNCFYYINDIFNNYIKSI